VATGERRKAANRVKSSSERFAKQKNVWLHVFMINTQTSDIKNTIIEFKIVS